MNDMPTTLRHRDVILLKTGEVVRLLSTDFRTMICRYSDGLVLEVRCSEYAGLLQPAAYDLEDTQEMPAVRL